MSLCKTVYNLCNIYRTSLLVSIFCRTLGLELILVVDSTCAPSPSTAIHREFPASCTLTRILEANSFHGESLSVSPGSMAWVTSSDCPPMLRCLLSHSRATHPSGRDQFLSGNLLEADRDPSSFRVTAAAFRIGGQPPPASRLRTRPVKVALPMSASPHSYISAMFLVLLPPAPQ